MRYVMRLAMVGLVLAAAGCGDGDSTQDPAPTTRPTSRPTTQQTAAPTAAPSPLIIDVRTAGEYARGHVKGAVNLPVSTINQTIGTHAPDLDRPILLYCRSGARARAAQGALGQLEYTDVTSGGGLGEMIDAGHDVE